MTTRSVMLRLPDDAPLYQALRRIAFDHSTSIPKVVLSILTDALRDTGALPQEETVGQYAIRVTTPAEETP